MIGLQPLTSDGSREKGAHRMKNTIVYLPHPSGDGMQPVSMTRKEAREKGYRRWGMAKRSDITETKNEE